MAGNAYPTAALWLFAVALSLPSVPAARQRYGLLAHRSHPAPDGVSPVRAGDPLALAGTLDLLAACLRAGLPMAAAAKSVAGSAPAPLELSLRRAADLLALGADPAAAWSAAADAGGPAAESLARLARRSARSGTSLASAISGLAAQSRDEAEDAAAARAERAGVLISGPLGLCFLPAFICLGIVPVVLGLATRVLSGGGLP